MRGIVFPALVAAAHPLHWVKVALWPREPSLHSPLIDQHLAPLILVLYEALMHPQPDLKLLVC